MEKEDSLEEIKSDNEERKEREDKRPRKLFNLTKKVKIISERFRC